ncbi:MAG: hypothetical protein M5U19_17635 [Microthrixaceae bacterium]|nr:hypothetical protein [Microthrixaceae bacterium]
MGSLPESEKSTRRRSNRRSIAGILAVAAVIAALLVSGTQSSAATSSKTFNASCSGADPGTAKLLKTIGSGSLATPVTVKADAPPFVEPGQTGVGFSLSLSFSLDTKTVDTVAAISPKVKVSKVNAPLAVTGPTSTKSITGTLPDQNLTLAKGKPFNAAFPPIKGTLNDIGSGGLIKVSTQELFFTITLGSGPIKEPLNFKCSTGATVLSLPVKVAGSPNIVQPIMIETKQGQPTTVDVLGKYVTNGKTKDGVEQKVDPSTLKILEGDATIVDGKVVATGPAAGKSAEVTFQVCAGTINISEADPGKTEVQEIRLFFDPNNQALKRELGSRFAFNQKSGDQVVWSVNRHPVAPNPPKDEVVEPGKNSWWQLHVNDYVLFNPHIYPSAADMQAGLESIPTIGAGGVKVTQGEIVSNGRKNVPEGVTLKGGMQYMPYTVEFSGKLANKAHDQIVVAQLYSFLPIEIKNSLLGLLDKLGGDDGGDGEGTPKTPIPDGLTAKEYVDQLSAEAARKGANGDIVGQIETIKLMIKVIGENLMDFIDIGEITSLLNDVFQSTPEVVTVTQGEDPAPEEKQELCSQGVVTLTSVATVSPETTVPPGPPPTVGGAQLKPTG